MQKRNYGLIYIIIVILMSICLAIASHQKAFYGSLTDLYLSETTPPETTPPVCMINGKETNFYTFDAWSNALQFTMMYLPSRHLHDVPSALADISFGKIKTLHGRFGFVPNDSDNLIPQYLETAKGMCSFMALKDEPLKKILDGYYVKNIHPLSQILYLPLYHFFYLFHPHPILAYYDVVYICIVLNILVFSLFILFIYRFMGTLESIIFIIGPVLLFIPAYFSFTSLYWSSFLNVFLLLIVFAFMKKDTLSNQITFNFKKEKLFYWSLFFLYIFVLLHRFEYATVTCMMPMLMIAWMYLSQYSMKQILTSASLKKEIIHIIWKMGIIFIASFIVSIIVSVLYFAFFIDNGFDITHNIYLYFHSLFSTTLPGRILNTESIAKPLYNVLLFSPDRVLNTFSIVLFLLCYKMMSPKTKSYYLISFLGTCILLLWTFIARNHMAHHRYHFYNFGYFLIFGWLALFYASFCRDIFHRLRNKS